MRTTDAAFWNTTGFGEYGFPESHAASFALLVYVSAWLKHYHPAAFCAAVVNSQPMGFYAPAQLVRDAREHGVEVLPVDVGASGWDCRLEGEGKLRLGFRLVAGLPQSGVEKMLAARDSRPFGSLDDLVRRTGLGRATLFKLAVADAFGSLGLARREALWQVLAQEPPLPLFAHLENDEAPVPLPRMEPAAEVAADYRTVGLSLQAHPIQFIRPLLDELGVTPAGQLTRLAHGRRLKVAGLVLLRQRPSTAKGITFVTLEDETGLSNLVVTHDVWERYRTAARRAGVLVAHGRLERQGEVLHVKVRKLEDYTALVGTGQNSRDFR